MNALQENLPEKIEESIQSTKENVLKRVGIKILSVLAFLILAGITVYIIFTLGLVGSHPG